MKRYFYTFLGAVRFRNGLPAVENWISALLNWSSAAANGVGTNHAANVDMDVRCFFFIGSFLIIFKMLGQCRQPCLMDLGQGRLE